MYKYVSFLLLPQKCEINLKRGKAYLTHSFGDFSSWLLSLLLLCVTGRGQCREGEKSTKVPILNLPPNVSTKLPARSYLLKVGFLKCLRFCYLN